MGKRRCKGKTKKGKPCGANPLKPGTVIQGVTVSGRWCRQHDEDLPDSARIGGATEGAGRPRKPRFSEVLAERMAERADEIFAPLIDGLKAERAVVVGTGPKARVEIVPDIPTRIAAAREILDRVEGKARQRSEISGPDGGEIPVSGAAIPAEADWHAAVLRLGQQVVANGNGHAN